MLLPAGISVSSLLSRLRARRLAGVAQPDGWRIVTFAGFLVACCFFSCCHSRGRRGGRQVIGMLSAWRSADLMPPMASVGPGLVAWLVGALFTARMLVSPFAAAKFTWELYERGMPRRLPVELPMSQDLPVALAQPTRSPIPYSDPGLRLSFLDQNAWPPEPPGMWISGAGEAEIILAQSVGRHLVEAESPIRTTVTVSLRDRGDTVLEPRKVATFTVPAGSPVRAGTGQRLSDDDALERRLRAPRRWIGGLPEPRLLRFEQSEMIT
jgi:hypothetical protein